MDPQPLTVTAPDGTLLSGESVGEGPAIVLLHGLTATRRYVVMGSRALERSGYRVISYDARGHGRSGPAADRDSYTYELLVSDLLAVLEAAGVERATLAGASMGAHTAVHFALLYPERVTGLALITPAYDPDAPNLPDAYAGWDALATGLRERGVEGFMDAQASTGALERVPERWRETVGTVMRQRLALHEHPDAVADALQAVPRSRPFERFEELGRLDVPTIVVGSRDESDPGHPLAIASRYAAAIPGAAMFVEEPGESPLAWRGGWLSKEIGRLATFPAGA